MMMVEAAQIDHGIASHARWKYRLFDAAKTGKSEWTVEQIRSYTDCEFGRWMASLSSAELQSEQCQAVTELHREFHAAASKVLDLALQKKSDEAQAAVALNSPFSIVSANLTAAMSAWKESLGKA